MIFHPRIGQRVRVHYGRSAAARMPWHGRVGVVRLVGHGPGPRNVGVEIAGRVIVVPRGNLVAVDRSVKRPKSTPAGTGVDGEGKA